MRHKVAGYKLSRNHNERKQLFRALIRELVLHGKIKTTVSKAKAMQPMIEQLITKAKTGTEAKRREIHAAVSDKHVTRRLMEYGKTVFSKRQSGFTRIVKMVPRKGDNTAEAFISFVDELPKEEDEKKPKAKKQTKSEPKKQRKTQKKKPEKASKK